jgi:hypothetical protein
METKQITINIPDFIDYEELKKELFINLKLEIKSEVKNMLKRDFFNSDEFKRVVVEEVAKYMSEIIKTTNAPDIIKCKIKEYVNSLDSDSYELKYNVIEPLIKEIVKNNKDEIIEILKPQLMDNVKLDDYEKQSILINIIAREIENGNYTKFIRDAILFNFEDYIPINKR